LTAEDKLSLITRNLVEVITEAELKEKLESGQRLRGYIGYEPSGLVHIGHLIWMNKVKDLVEAGVHFVDEQGQGSRGGRNTLHSP